MVYHELAIGRPFDLATTDLSEGDRLTVHGNLVLFASFRDGPDAGLIDAVRRGRCELSLWSSGRQVVVCLHCHSARGELWADAPFDIRRQAGAEACPAPPPSAAEPAFGEAIVALVDAGSGLVKALRAVSLSDQFTRSLSAAIHTQGLAPLDEAEAEHDMLGLYARYPTPERLARACEVRCEGWA